MMQLFDAIDTRASALKLTEPAPRRDELERIISAGARAPDHGKLAPWRFVVLGNKTRQQLGEAMAQTLRVRSPGADAEQLQRERNKVARAPCIVAIAARFTQPHKVPKDEQLLAVGAAVQNMFLAAHSLGYGAMWKTGPAAYSTAVNNLLGLHAEDQIVALLYLGTVSLPGTARGAVFAEPVQWLD